MVNNLSHVSHRSTLFFLMIGTSFIILGSKVFLDARSFTAPINVPIPIAKVESITNVVKVKHSRDFLWNNATIGQSIENNSFVYADKKSQAVISFKDGSKLVLLPGSIVEIVSSKNGKFDFKVEKGKVISLPPASSTLKPEVITVAEPTGTAEQINPSFIYLVDTKTKAFIRDLRPATFRINWNWSGVPNPSDQLVLKVSGPKEDEVFRLNTEQTFTDVKLKYSGTFDWFLYLNDELMSGGSVDFNLLVSPYLRSPASDLISDTGEVEFNWDYSIDVDSFEVEISSNEGVSSHQVSGDQRKFTKKLELNSAYSWRVRSNSGQLAGPWGEEVSFFLKSKKPYFLDQMNDLIAQIKPLFTLDGLPETLDLNLEDMPDYSLEIQGTKKLGYDQFKIEGPGTYVVEILHLKSGYKTTKSFKVDLSSIQETLMVPEIQEIKVLGN